MSWKPSRVGVDDGQLLDTDLTYFESIAVPAVLGATVARQIFPIVTLDSIGIKEWTVHRITGMSRASIDMDGLNKSFDKSVKVPHTVKVPEIHKETLLLHRDIAASRRNGPGLDTTEAEQLALVVAAEEDLLLLSGHRALDKMLSIEGLLSSTGRNTEASLGSWGTTPLNAYNDFSDAKEELEADGHMGPYTALVTPAQNKVLDKFVSSTIGMSVRRAILQELNVSRILVSPNLYATDDNVQDSAILCEPGPLNFVLGVAQPIQAFTFPIGRDYELHISEIATPHVKRPTSICELTTITLS